MDEEIWSSLGWRRGQESWTWRTRRRLWRGIRNQTGRRNQVGKRRREQQDTAEEATEEKY